MEPSLSWGLAEDRVWVLLGIASLAAAALLDRFRNAAFSYPILVLMLGFVAVGSGFTPKLPDLREHPDWIRLASELGVILSLMGVGLKLDRAPSLRGWSSACWLLIAAMPLTILAASFLGYWLLGLVPAAALLLGAAVAPTDPVLADEVQVGEPTVGDGEQGTAGPGTNDGDSGDEDDGEDELRFALTAEAGLNDALAFPFTYLAIVLLAAGGGAIGDATGGWAPGDALLDWFWRDVIYRIVVGCVAGVAIGWVLAQILLRLPVRTELDRMRTGVGALAATLLLYGGTEAISGYGFIAVFVGALTIRNLERTDKSHRSLHVFAEQSEQLAMTAVLLGLGAAIAGGLLVSITWIEVLVAAAIVLVIRPVCAGIALLPERKLRGKDYAIAAFFGVKGIGTLFYLSYALEQADFPGTDTLWNVCTLTIVISVFVHGILAGPLIRRRDRSR